MSDIRIFATTKQLVIYLQTSVDTHQVILRKTHTGMIQIVNGGNTWITPDQVQHLYGEAIVGKWLRGEV
jgi:hypothetical protein